MYRGTTPTLEFALPYGAALVEAAYVTFQQNGAVAVEKSLEDDAVTLGEGTLSVTLSQAETLALSAQALVRIQLRLKLQGGNAVASQVICTSVEDILKEGVI